MIKFVVFVQIAGGWFDDAWFDDAWFDETLGIVKIMDVNSKETRFVIGSMKILEL